MAQLERAWTFIRGRFLWVAELGRVNDCAGGLVWWSMAVALKRWVVHVRE